jgi:hypothetical protein
MSQELGKIEKPEADNFKHSRKICQIPLIYSGENAPPEFVEKYNLYWQQVTEQVNNLVSKLGSVNHIFHESISETGEEGLNVLEKLNPKSYELIKNTYQEGAHFEGMEDKVLWEETIDWQRCLMMGLISEKVMIKVSEYFTESSKKRYEFIARKIDETLKPNEVALLLINERHMVQFPGDIEVFKIAPPALNDIYRWLRDRQQQRDISDTETAK